MSARRSQATWEKIEALSDLLAEHTDLETGLGFALSAILEMIDHPGGLLLVQSPADQNPFLTVQKNAPPSFEIQFQDVASPVRKMCSNVMETGLAVQPSPAGGLAMVAPICSNTDRQGALLLFGDPLDAGEIEIMQQAIRPLNRAIKVARSYLVMKELSQELAALHLASDVINSSLEFDEMEAWMVKGICRILNTEAGSLLLIDEDHPGLLIKKTLGAEPDWVYQANFKWGDGIEEQCIRARAPVKVNDIRPGSGPDLASIANPNYELHSILCAPLTVNEETVGAISLINKRSGPFTSFDQELLAAMATSVANALYNTRLIQQLKVANADLEASRWQLLRSRNTLRALFDSIPASIYIVDQKYNLVALNMTRSSKANNRPSALVGKQCYEAFYDREDICPGCRVMETLLSGQNTTRTRRQWDADDQPMEWEISTYPIRDDSGEVVQAILLEQDVTEKRRLEATLAQSEKLAAVGQLAAGVAHEINNPLTAIIANAQMLQRELPADDERQELVDLISRAGNRATQVVRNLLDFARKEHYEFAPTDINETIQRALSLIQHELVSRSVSLNFEPSDDLPLVMASQDHLQGVWLNLIMNAIDAFEGSAGQIRVLTRPVNNEARVSVIDNGKGIPPERLNRIFEPFYTTKSPGRGTGLGLSVCHRIVKQHGGHILVNSEVGKGTEFVVVLPAS
jgi:two-component system, NtrC family, sensor kinase